MSSYIRRIPLLAVAILLGACDSAPVEATAPVAVTPRRSSSASGAVERSVEEYVYDLDGSFTQVACDDGTESELIALEGKIFRRTVSSTNPAGAIHYVSHSMPIGLRGVGTVSGEEYRVREQEHAAVSQRLMGYAGTLRQVFELTGRDSHRTFKIVTIAHYTLNANNEPIVARDEVRTECGG
jgi:hypothetical protein